MASAARNSVDSPMMAMKVPREIVIGGGPVAALHAELVRHYPPIDAGGGVWQVQTVPMTRGPRIAGILRALIA